MLLPLSSCCFFSDKDGVTRPTLSHTGEHRLFTVVPGKEGMGARSTFTNCVKTQCAQNVCFMFSFYFQQKFDNVNDPLYENYGSRNSSCDRV